MVKNDEYNPNKGVENILNHFNNLEDEIDKLAVVGDVHGQIERYLWTVLPYKQSIQVGDMGVGLTVADLPELEGHRFINGNHDNPKKCSQHSNWIPYGAVESINDQEWFFMGGAMSIDRDFRVPGVSWWPEEELNYQQLNRMISIYEGAKPDVVVTHDCPDSIAQELFDFSLDHCLKSQTRQALDTMLEIHRPSRWIFGHWHESRCVEIKGTEFICLDELEVLAHT